MHVIWLLEASKTEVGFEVEVEGREVVVVCVCVLDDSVVRCYAVVGHPL